MKPIKKTRIIEYWDCGENEHNHKNKHTAESCIARRPKGTKKRLTRDYLMEMLRLKNAGENMSAIARQQGKSVSTVMRAARKAERILNYEERTGLRWGDD